MSKFRLDEVDHQILDMLIDNTVPFTDIAIINFCWDRSRYGRCRNNKGHR
jgi:hypothetical protein